MTTENMSVHRAMREIKMLDKKISDASTEAVFVTHTTKGADSVGGVKKDKKMETMRSEYQQLCDWMKRLCVLKTAVQQSNAVTKVIIQGVEYTVAEAIAKKNYDMEHKKTILRSMVHQFNTAQIRIENNNATLEQRANDRLKAIYGNVTSTNAADAEATKKAFIENETAVLVDPMNIDKLIKELKDEIDAFESEVDAVLSESNAVTMLKITY